MANNKTTIDGIDYDLWSVSGRIAGVLVKSTTDVWTSGGGGFVDGRGGAYIQPVHVQTSTRNFKEVRVDGDDGQAHTVTLHDDVRAFVGDRVTLAYIGLEKEQRGRVHGFVNHRENHWWTFNAFRIAKPDFRKSIYRAVARFICDHPFISYFGGLLALTTMFSANYRPTYRLDQVPRYPLHPWFGTLLDGFWPMTIALVAVIIVCSVTTTALRKRVNKGAQAAINAFTAQLNDEDKPATAVGTGDAKAA